MCYLNGSYVSEAEGKLPITDLGLLRGYGIFDYLRTYKGIPFHLWDHLLRLKYSAEQIGLELSHSLEEIETIILTLLKKNHYPESSIKILFTGGVSTDQLMPDGKATLAILVYPFTPFPQECYARGLRTITTPLSRSISYAKTTHYIPAIIALHQARQADVQDALYLNPQREILEATTSNFFAFKEGTLLTSDSPDIMHGITREVILKLSPFPVEIRPIAYTELLSLEEIFLSSSNLEIMPVSEIDGIRFKLGPQTRKLMDSFRNYTMGSHWDLLKIQRYSTLV